VDLLQELCPRRIDGWSGSDLESHVEAPLSPCVEYVNSRVLKLSLSKDRIMMTTLMMVIMMRKRKVLQKIAKVNMHRQRLVPKKEIFIAVSRIPHRWGQEGLILKLQV
jgi:hypothetical protein